jgi:hypothetical protein
VSSFYTKICRENVISFLMGRIQPSYFIKVK